MYSRLLRTLSMLCIILMSHQSASAQCVTPFNLNTANIKATKATASWYAVLGQKYEVELATNGSTKSTFVTANANITTGFLSPNTLYSYKVRATCIGGAVSNWSGPSTFMTTGDAVCPVPTGVTSSNITATGAKLEWAAGASAQNYYIGFDNGSRFLTSANSYTFSGLKANTTYNYTLYAQCSGVIGNSVSGSFTTSTTTCATPTNAAVLNVGANRASITFTNTSGANSHKIECKLSTETTYKIVSTFMSDLLPNSTYNYRVSATCAGVQSAPSAVQNFTTSVAPACANTPANLVIDTVSTYNAKASWTAVSGATSYKIEWSNASGISGSANVVNPTYQFSGLTPTTNYNIKVSAVCAAAQGVASIAIPLLTMPVPTSCGMPTAITVSNIELQKAKINWTMPTGVTYCKVQVLEAGSTVPMVFGTTSNSFTLSNLNPNSTYTYKVASTCGSNNNVGTYSSAQSFSTLSLSVCDKTTNMTTSNITANSVKANWALQPNVTQYKVQVSKVGASSSAFTVTNKQSISISNLLDNTAYDVNVTAVCAANTNSDLNTMNFSTLSNTVCVDYYEPNETISAATPLTPGVSKSANIALPTDKDLFTFTVSPNAPNFKISLTNLPKDYDLHLYNAYGFLIGWSTNYLAADEQIIRYNQTPGIYYVKVSGYSSAYTTSACYDLKVDLSATATFPLVKQNTKVETDIIFEENTENTNSAFAKPIGATFEIKNTFDFSLTPNPAQDEVTISLGKEISGNISIALYDLTGRLLRDVKVNTDQSGQQLKMDVSELEAGLYFISVDNGSFRKTSKLTVQN